MSTYRSRPAGLRLCLSLLGVGLVASACAGTPRAQAPANVEPAAPPTPPPLRPLTPEEDALRADLESECGQLAELGPRSLAHSWNLHSATDHIALKLEKLGYEVVRQGFPVGDEVLQNLEVVVPGTHTGETLVIAAHYDSPGDSPGANASASGSVALLSLAKELRGKRFARSLRLVWLSNESGDAGHTGSAAYAERTRRQRVPVVATLTLGSLGNYSLAPGSQRYPDELLYGAEHRRQFGDFLAVLSNAGSHPLLERVRPALSAASLPVEELILPDAAPLAAEGPQARFWSAGLSGLLLTDTAHYRTPFPAGPEDTPERLDYDRLARVTRLLSTLVDTLAAPALPSPTSSSATSSSATSPPAASSPATPPSAAFPASSEPPAPETPPAPPAATAPGDLLPELPPLVEPPAPTPPG